MNTIVNSNHTVLDFTSTTDHILRRDIHRSAMVFKRPSIWGTVDIRLISKRVHAMRKELEMRGGKL